jgi:hypothetical protein
MTIRLTRPSGGGTVPDMFHGDLDEVFQHAETQTADDDQGAMMA